MFFLGVVRFPLTSQKHASRCIGCGLASISESVYVPFNGLMFHPWCIPTPCLMERFLIHSNPWVEVNDHIAFVTFLRSLGVYAMRQDMTSLWLCPFKSTT